MGGMIEQLTLGAYIVESFQTIQRLDAIRDERSIGGKYIVTNWFSLYRFSLYRFSLYWFLLYEH